ncbi:transposase [Variovorax sp. ZT5P49]|uniref:transposase n=1 Tax=Variovorax sp. ZT5P49 TaxID=3443733 RepID=UPI003F4713D0
MRPGVSVAAVALAHSLNANMLSKWVIDAQHNPPTLPPAVSPQEPRRNPRRPSSPWP